MGELGLQALPSDRRRWVDALACYGPKETRYTRWVRWAEKGGACQEGPAMRSIFGT